MPAIPTNLSPEGHDDQAITAVKINKILSERLPALVSGKIPVDAALSVGSLTISGVAQETTLSSINTKIPSNLTVTSTRLLVDGSGVTQPVSIKDGSGTAITSTLIGGKQRLDVSLSSAGTTGTAVPTTANLYGGSDGTNLQAISVDTSGRVNVNVNGTVPVSSTYRTASSSRTAGTAATTTTSVTMLASNANRLGFVISNSEASTTILYIRFAAAAASSTSFDIALPGGQTYQQMGPVVYTGEIRGILSAAGTNGAKASEFVA